MQNYHTQNFGNEVLAVVVLQNRTVQFHNKACRHKTEAWHV